MGRILRFSHFIVDKITGFNITSELGKVLAMDEWTKPMIENDQKSKFKKLSIIAGNSEFYNSYKGCDLAKYPIMNREDFKKNFENLKTNIRKPYSIQHTSGSTSNPVTHYISREMLLAKRVSHQKLLHWNGLKRESPEFKIGGIKEDYITSLYYLLRNKRYINSFEINEQNIKRILRKYNDFKPSVLYGYPSAIYNMLQYADNKGVKLHSPTVIITHAETLCDEYKDKFQNTFPGISVLNQYWSTEANIAETCPEGNLHIDEDTVICELINTNENGVGDLLITNLYSYDLPIIRYKIGDRVRFSDVDCQCGRQTQILKSIEGRDNDFLELPDGRKIPLPALYFSRYMKNIISYQLVYFKTQRLIEFRYVCFKEDEINKAKIADHLKKDYGLSTRFVRVEELRYTPGGKFKKLLISD